MRVFSAIINLFATLCPLKYTCMKWIIFWTVEKIWTWTRSSQWNEQPKRLKNDDLSSLIFSVSSICSWKYDLFHIFQFINNNNNDNNDNNHHHHSMVMIRVTMIMMLMIIIIIMILKMKIIIIKKKQTFIKLLSNWKLNTNLE